MLPSFSLDDSLDFGVDHLVEIASQTEFPWLMSNVRDRHTGRLLAEGRESLVLDWEGRKVWMCLRVMKYDVLQEVEVLLCFSQKASCYKLTGLVSLPLP